MKRILAAILVVMLIFPTCIAASQEKVYVRIEGYDETILQMTEIEITEPFDLVEKGYSFVNSEEFTALHAIIVALEANDVSFVCEGGFISQVSDIDSTDHDEWAGWMFGLNGDMPETSMAETLVNSGDELVLYYNADFSGMMNANFTELKKKVTRGREANFELMASPVDLHDWSPNFGISAPYEGAKIYVDGVDSEIVTDASGQAKLVFDKAGTYVVTAVKENEQGQNILTHNYCVVTVTAPSSGSSGGGSPVKPLPEPEPEPLPEPEPVAQPKVFRDIPEGYWGKGAVEYTSAKGLFRGISDDEFAPDLAVTRGMFVTVLNRMAGLADDADPSKWLLGTDNGLELDSPITREQMVVMLKRFNGEGSLDKADIGCYGDNEAVSEWARDSVEWAVAQGLIQGDDAGLLVPKSNVTRIQVAVILQRLDSDKTQLDYICDEMATSLLLNVPNPGVGQVGGDWVVFGLAQGGYEVPKGYYENVSAYIKELDGVLSTTKYTEYARVVIALTASGHDASDVSGYDLIAPLKDFDKVSKQGVNGITYAILALGTDEYVEELAARQGDEGSFNSDIDATAMAVQALAKYRDVSDAIEFLEQNKPETAEGWAQVVVAYCEADKEPPVNELIAYYLPGRGFSHTIGGEYSQMATEQAFYALVAARRFRDGEKGIWEK